MWIEMSCAELRFVAGAFYFHSNNILNFTEAFHSTREKKIPKD